MYSQSTSGSTQPGERPVTLATYYRHGNTPAWSTPLKRERERERVSQSAHFFCPSSPHRFSSTITGKNRDVVRPSSLCSRVVLAGTTARPGPPGPVPDMDKLFREMKAVGSSPHRVAVSSFRPINVNCRRHKSPSGPRSASSRPAVTDNSYSRATPLQMSYR